MPTAGPSTSSSGSDQGKSDQYVFPTIDKQKVLIDARKKSQSGTVIVHMHSKQYKCESYQHVMFQNGIQVDEWGEIDGSSNSTQLHG